MVGERTTAVAPLLLAGALQSVPVRRLERLELPCVLLLCCSHGFPDILAALFIRPRQRLLQSAGVPGVCARECFLELLCVPHLSGIHICEGQLQLDLLQRNRGAVNSFRTGATLGSDGRFSSMKGSGERRTAKSVPLRSPSRIPCLVGDSFSEGLYLVAKTLGIFLPLVEGLIRILELLLEDIACLRQPLALLLRHIQAERHEEEFLACLELGHC